MKLRLDEYYYIISDEFDEIEDYMPENIANKYLEFCKSHNSDEVDDYLKRLYSYIQAINLEYTILDIDLEKANILSIVDFFGLLYIISFFILPSPVNY